MELGPYRLIERIGTGGMGEVWKAEDTKLLRIVALKLLREDAAGNEEWKARFLREARTAARLSHPNIATIYAIDEAESRMYIAMEYVDGESLGTLIEKGTLRPEDVVRIIKRCADALSEAHANGIIHRDVKPDNIIVTPRSVKMLDFGIAKMIGGAPGESGQLTTAGMVVGTPDYMSPEQALGKAVDHRSDIFSLGVVLYEALSGKHPFAGPSVTETLVRIVTKEPPDITTLKQIPPELGDIVRRALRKKPEERFETARLMAAALDKVYGHASSPFPAITSEPKPDARRSDRSLRAIQERRVLVADDDPASRKALCDILAQHRFEYDEATNGAEAIQQLKRRRYGLAFIDLMMPRVDGWAVVDYLRSRTEHRGMKTFVVSTGEQRLSTADRDVVSGVVAKPFDAGKIDLLLRNFAQGN